MTNPLRDPAPAEVTLARPPLHRVLVGINFPAILKISEERGIIGFQDRIRKVYPNLQHEQELGLQIQLGASGEMLPPQQIISSVWRFMSTDGTWRVTLATQTIALETQGTYQSRDDFLDRLGTILGIFAAEFEPSESMRIGVRYLNLMNADDLETVKRAVRSGLRSLSDTEISEQIAASAHSVTFNVPEGGLLTRWGVLPPNVVHDPNMMIPVPTRRWYLDLDCSSEQPLSFHGDAILDDCRSKAERIYAFFRWAMTPEFFESQLDA